MKMANTDSSVFPKRYNPSWDGVLISLDGKCTVRFLNYSPSAQRRKILFWMAFAIQHLYPHGRTLRVRQFSIRRWFDFLEERFPEIEELREISPAVWDVFQRWLRTRGDRGTHSRALFHAI